MVSTNRVTYAYPKLIVDAGTDRVVMQVDSIHLSGDIFIKKRLLLTPG